MFSYISFTKATFWHNIDYGSHMTQTDQTAIADDTASSDALTRSNVANNFKDAYEILKANADRLEKSDTLDIDNLVAIVEESLAAYKVCQSRIDAVESALATAFADADMPVDDD